MANKSANGVYPINKVDELLTKLYGNTAWDVKVGHGSFLTIEFGEPTPAAYDKQQLYGEWHLWVYSGLWIVEADSQILAASEDTNSKLQNSAKIIDGKKLLRVDFHLHLMHTEFAFDENVKLHILNTQTEVIEESKGEAWMLYTPNNMVLTMGPAGEFFYEDGDK